MDSSRQQRRRISIQSLLNPVAPVLAPLRADDDPRWRQLAPLPGLMGPAFHTGARLAAPQAVLAPLREDDDPRWRQLAPLPGLMGPRFYAGARLAAEGHWQHQAVVPQNGHQAGQPVGAQQAAGAQPTALHEENNAKMRAARRAENDWISADPLSRNQAKWEAHEERMLYRLYQAKAKSSAIHRILHRTLASCQAHKANCVRNGRWEGIAREVRDEDAVGPEKRAAAHEELERARLAMEM
ncbi:hypothetical protein QBC39DRAFT_375093 [Podospora conica]|nr:hypothetical protein QBC39DRAFT_375093 [Schizothecium conicum]